MKLSIIMSVYNNHRQVERAINSILDQSFKEFEFIIVDDHSNDSTPKIIRKYARKDKRIKFIENTKNIGLTKSLNKAIAVAKGSYIARQDGDDVSFQFRIIKQILYLDNNPEIAFCGCNGYPYHNKSIDLIKYFNLHDIRKNLIFENCFLHSSVMIRKDVVEKYGYYDEKFLYGQDYELWCRLVYRYKLNALNLNEKLILMDIPYEIFLKKKIKKFVVQRLNSIKTKFKYLNYSNNKWLGISSIIIKLIEIFSLSYILGYISKFRKNFNSN